MDKVNIRDLVINKTAKFVSYKNGNFFYKIDDFQFAVPLEDISGATLKSEDKAIFFMRWIRKHIDQTSGVQ